MLRTTLTLTAVVLLAHPGGGELTAPPPVQRSTILLESGSEPIRLVRHAPATGEPSPIALLLVPGWPATGGDVLGLGAGLASRGLQIFVLYPRGHEGSGGTSTFAGAVDDVAAAWEWLAAENGGRLLGIDPDQRALAGYSWGGGIAMAYAAADRSVRRAVSIAGSDHGAFIRRIDADPAYRKRLTAALVSTRAPEGPVRFDLDAALDELRTDHATHDLVTLAPALADRELLIVAGWLDDEVEIEHHVLPFRRALAASGATSVRMLAYDDGHAFRVSRPELVRDLSQWILGPGSPGDKATADANKLVVLEMMAAIDRRDLDALDGLVAADVRRRSGATPGLEIDSLDGFKAFLAADFETVPDSTQTVHRILGEGDLVAVEATYSGMQEGAFGPFPPSGRRVEIPFVAVIRVAGGLIREIRVEWDNLNALTQLGHVPPAGPPDETSEAHIDAARMPSGP